MSNVRSPIRLFHKARDFADILTNCAKIKNNYPYSCTKCSFNTKRKASSEFSKGKQTTFSWRFFQVTNLKKLAQRSIHLNNGLPWLKRRMDSFSSALV